MRFPGFIGIARFAPFVVAFFLCLVAFLHPYQLTQPVTGMEMAFSKAPVTVHSASSGAEKPMGGHTLAGNYLAAFLEEAEIVNQSSVNAEHLTVLLLVVFFGVLLGVLGGKRTWRKKKAFLFLERRVTPVAGSPPRKLAPPLLSVFLL